MKKLIVVASIFFIIALPVVTIWICFKVLEKRGELITASDDYYYS